MKRLFLPLILFFLLVMEGVSLELLPASFITSSWIIVPHWCLIFIIFIAIFYDQKDTYLAIWLAIIFGLLFDIVHTGILGPYMFTYAVTIYLIHSLMKMLYQNFYVTLAMTIVGVAAADYAVHIIYSVIGLVTVPMEVYALTRLVPTILANVLFVVMMYPIVTKLLIRWKKDELST